jgi:hypothetical protein
MGAEKEAGFGSGRWSAGLEPHANESSLSLAGWRLGQTLTNHFPASRGVYLCGLAGGMKHFEGFDPGSERTLAAWIRHASRGNPAMGNRRKGQ